MLNIDFFQDAERYIDNPKEVKPVSAVIEPEPIKEPPSLIAGYEVTEDLNNIIFKGTSYSIPSWYNRKMIAQGDSKTIEMVLIHYGLI